MRDVKYLHKSCNTKKSIHKMRNATSCIFSTINQYINGRRRKKSDYIKVFLFIFSFYYFLLLVSPCLALLWLGEEKFRVVLFTE